VWFRRKRRSSEFYAGESLGSVHNIVENTQLTNNDIRMTPGTVDFILHRHVVSASDVSRAM
jgi:hypothetical protein